MVTMCKSFFDNNVWRVCNITHCNRAKLFVKIFKAKYLYILIIQWRGHFCKYKEVFFLHCRTIKPVQGGILHPPKVHVSKNANMKYDRPLLKDCITTFVLFSNVFHPSCEILNLKNNFIRKNKFPTTHFLIR